MGCPSYSFPQAELICQSGGRRILFKRERPTLDEPVLISSHQKQNNINNTGTVERENRYGRYPKDLVITQGRRRRMSCYIKCTSYGEYQCSFFLQQRTSLRDEIYPSSWGGTKGWFTYPLKHGSPNYGLRTECDPRWLFIQPTAASEPHI